MLRQITKAEKNGKKDYDCRAEQSRERYTDVVACFVAWPSGTTSWLFKSRLPFFLNNGTLVFKKYNTSFELVSDLWSIQTTPYHFHSDSSTANIWEQATDMMPRHPKSGVCFPKTKETLNIISIQLPELELLIHHCHTVYKAIHISPTIPVLCLFFSVWGSKSGTHVALSCHVHSISATQEYFLVFPCLSSPWLKTSRPFLL